MVDVNQAPHKGIVADIIPKCSSKLMLYGKQLNCHGLMTSPFTDDIMTTIICRCNTSTKVLQEYFTFNFL